MRIGATYFGGDRELLEQLLPVVDFIETTPDSIARIRRGRATIPDETGDDLRRIARERKLLLHGVGLSIASHDGMDRDYLALLDDLFSIAPPAWHSEHLGYTRVDGRPLGTMLVPPRTEEVVQRISERAIEVRERYDAPFLLENVVNLLPEHPRHDYSPAQFLNEIARRSGCGLIVDVYNLECEQHNQRLDVDAFLRELDFAHVRELHIANGVIDRGLMLDVHSRLLRPETLALADRIVERATNAEVLIYELLPQAVPALGRVAIVNELTMLRARYAAGDAEHSGAARDVRQQRPAENLSPGARDLAGRAAHEREASAGEGCGRRTDRATHPTRSLVPAGDDDAIVAENDGHALRGRPDAGGTRFAQTTAERHVYRRRLAGPHHAELASLQRDLAALVRGRAPATDDAYLSHVAQSTGLAVTRNVIASWRELLLRQALPLTFALLDVRDRTAAALASLAGESTSPFIEQLAPQFLEPFLDDEDDLLAEIARFERAVILAQQNAATDEDVRWPEPPPRIEQLLRGTPRYSEELRGT